MISWITDKIGTCAYNNSLEKKDFHIIDVRNLVDKSGNSSDAIKEKIDSSLNFLKQNQKIVICCDYGMSRSNAIAAGVIAKHNNISFNEALAYVLEKTQQEIKLEVLSVVQNAVEENTPIYFAETRILVTGGTGLIGKNIIPLLQKYHFVIFPTREELDLLASPTNLRTYIQTHHITHILHLASPRIHNSYKSFSDALSMLRNILEVCRIYSIHLCYLSGWVVYSGYESNELMVNEETPLWPKGLYGETKYFCENLIDYYIKQYSIKYTIFRSSAVYGTGDMPKFLYNFINKAANNSEIITHEYANGLPKLNLLHIDDLANFFQIFFLDIQEGYFNLSSSNFYSTFAISQHIVKILNSTSSIKTQKIDGNNSNIFLNSKKAQKVFNWSPQVQWEESLKKICQQWSEENAFRCK